MNGAHQHHGAVVHGDLPGEDLLEGNHRMGGNVDGVHALLGSAAVGVLAGEGHPDGIA